MESQQSDEKSLKKARYPWQVKGHQQRVKLEDNADGASSCHEETVLRDKHSAAKRLHEAQDTNGDGNRKKKFYGENCPEQHVEGTVISSSVNVSQTKEPVLQYQLHSSEKATEESEDPEKSPCDNAEDELPKSPKQRDADSAENAISSSTNMAAACADSASLRMLDTCSLLLENAMMEDSSGTDSDSDVVEDGPGLAATDRAVQEFARRVIHTITHTYVQLRKWQTRHMARSIIDNAINKVLEDSGLAPGSMETGLLDVLNEEDVVTDEQENDQDVANSIEAQGVSAAILNRGLHIADTTNTSRDQSSPDASATAIRNDQVLLTHNWTLPSPVPPTTSQAEYCTRNASLPCDGGNEQLLDAAVSVAISQQGLNF